MLALSGGIDSCSTATIAFSMCREAVKAIKQGNQEVIEDVRRICADPDPNYLPKTPQELCGKIFHTCYMGTEKASSAETRQRAEELAAKIGAYHTVSISQFLILPTRDGHII